MTAKEILKSWDAVRPVFKNSPRCAPRMTEWIDLLRVVQGGKRGVKLNDLRGDRNYTRYVAMITRWQAAGLVTVWNDVMERHPLNHKAPLRVRALPRASVLLRVTDPLPPENL